jgi:hypothetical protein
MKTVLENQILKNSFDILKENLPKIQEKAEKRNFSQLIDSSKEILKIINLTEQNVDMLESYIEDMNIECNKMFDFISKTKITKNLKNLIIEVLLSTIHINETYGKQIIYVEEHDNGKYEGDIKDGKREGYGIYYYSTDYIYEGEYKNGHKDGHGSYIYANGNKYEGWWKEEKKLVWNLLL